MEEVTDTVFRQIVIRAGRPDLFITEFTSTDGLCTAGRPRVIGRLRFAPEERPLVAQIWGNSPERCCRVAAEIRAMGFDGVDLNMGCPVPKVVARGACAGLIANPSLAAELVAAAREGAAGLPVSVKTRIGIAAPMAERWLGFLLEQGISALTVHGRTVAQQSDGTADWSAVSLAVRLRDRAGLSTRIVGNGDVKNVGAFLRRAAETGADGVMAGRGVFENLFLFRAIGAARDGQPGPVPEFGSLTTSEKIAWFRAHIELHAETWGQSGRFDVLKKFGTTYLRAFEGAGSLIDAVMRCRAHEAALSVLADWEASRGLSARALAPARSSPLGGC